MKRPTEIAVVLGLLLIGGAGLAYVAALGQAEQSRETSLASLNAQPRGLRAAHDLLARHYSVRQSVEPWTQLDAATSEIIISQPFSRPPNPLELEGLARWIRGGGIAVLSSRNRYEPFDPLDPIAGDAAAIMSGNSNAHAKPVGRPRLTLGVDSISVPGSARLVPKLGSAWERVIADDSGCIAMQKPFGRGQIILISDNGIFANEWIGRDSNGVLLANIAGLAATGGHTIAFDDYHLGIGIDATPTSSGGMLSGLSVKMRRAAVFATVVGLLYIVNGNRRFGPAVRRVQRESSPDYIISLANLLRRAGANRFALQMVQDEALRAVAKKLRLPERSEHATIYAAATRLPRGRDFVEVMQRCDAQLQTENLSRADVMAAVLEIDTVKGNNAVG